MPMSDVAEEAGVTRSTLYRYFATRADLVVALVASRIDAAYERIVRGLSRPEDARRSITDFVLAVAGLADAEPLNEALMSEASRELVAALGYRSEAVVDTAVLHLGPLLRRWQADGQLHADLDIRDTIRWINLFVNTLADSWWREQPQRRKREIVEQYLVRALVGARGQDSDAADAIV